MKFNGITLALVMVGALIGYFGPRIYKWIEEYNKREYEFQAGAMQAYRFDRAMKREDFLAYRETVGHDTPFDKGFHAYCSEFLEKD